MVPLAKSADETQGEKKTIQIKSFFTLVAISLHANGKMAISWSY